MVFTTCCNSVHMPSGDAECQDALDGTAIFSSHKKWSCLCAFFSVRCCAYLEVWNCTDSIAKCLVFRRLWLGSDHQISKNISWKTPYRLYTRLQAAPLYFHWFIIVRWGPPLWSYQHTWWLHLETKAVDQQDVQQWTKHTTVWCTSVQNGGMEAITMDPK